MPDVGEVNYPVNVTLRPDAGVLSITGTGLSPDLLVTVDGPQLRGATDTQEGRRLPDT